MRPTAAIDPPAPKPDNFAMASLPPDSAPAVANFERALDELELVVQKMEKGEQSLDESLAAYERGIALYRDCRQALERAEQRVRMLADPADPERAEEFPRDVD
jgi:exodeoxyribonuclease VII small subunit